MKKFSIIFFSVMFVIGTDTFLISPLLPTLTNYYSISASFSGWMVSAYALGYIVSALVAGPISDGHSRRKIMMIGLVAFALSTFLCGVSETFGMMLVARFMAGISVAFVGPQVWASIPIVVPRKDIVKVMGYTAAGLSVSQIMGIPIGSYLADVTWRLPFFFVSAMAVILCFIVALQLPDLNRGISQKQSFLKIYGHLLKNKRALIYLLAYLVFQTGDYCSLSFVGTWFNKDFSLNVSGIGRAMIVIGLGSLMGTFFGSKIVARFGIKKTFLTEFLIYILLYLILPFSHLLLMAQVILTLIFLVMGCLFPLFMMTLQETTATARSTVSSLANAAMYLGETIGGIVGGILIVKFSGFFGIALFTTSLTLISLLFYVSGGMFSSESKKAQ